jgi:hypothetical protein
MSPDAEAVQQSFVAWIFSSLGFPYVVLLPLAGLLCFLLALILVLRGKGPMAAASLVLIVPVPFLIGVFAAIRGGIASYTVIAMSTTNPKPSDVAAGISTALVAPLVGMLLMVPGYATAMLGAFIRSFGADAAQSARKH